MQRTVAIFIFASAMGACVNQQSGPAAKASADCYTESGWLDATNGCSIRAGYPDCYLVCPAAGTRRKL